MIRPGYKTNLQTLQRAAKAGDLGLMECTDAKTGQVVIVVVARRRDPEGLINMVPLAKMFDGNPYEEVIPPGGMQPGMQP